jgi:hypothetical protein
MATEKRKANLIRPGTLAQVLQLVREGEKLRFCLAGFLDDFYGDADPGSRARHISEDPGLTDDPKMNALLGAVGEHLTMRWNLGSQPIWTNQTERFLDRPWFMGHERIKGFLLAESPLASDAVSSSPRPSRCGGRACRETDAGGHVKRSGAASFRPPRSNASSTMRARQRWVERFSRRITADARRPIWPQV